jgi:3-hydroxyisobutyrate dehydrogenase-like beta-hydroxyacid dehydrogenase
VLAATPLAGPAERRRPSIEDGDYPRRFALALARKDSELIIDAAREEGVDVRVLDAARTWLANAEEVGFGDRDYSTLLVKIIGTD